MNPVTGVGAPAYASGVQEWKGNCAELEQQADPNQGHSGKEQALTLRAITQRSVDRDKVNEPE